MDIAVHSIMPPIPAVRSIITVMATYRIPTVIPMIFSRFISPDSSSSLFASDGEILSLSSPSPLDSDGAYFSYALNIVIDNEFSKLLSVSIGARNNPFICSIIHSKMKFRASAIFAPTSHSTPHSMLNAFATVSTINFTIPLISLLHSAVLFSKSVALQTT